MLKMSLNTAHIPGGGVLIHYGECILLYSEDVHVEFSGIGSAFEGSKTGRLYLTTHRMIFINKSNSDKMISFSFPFVTIRDIEIEQPVFGANYLKGKVKAQPDGNWTGEAKFKLHFKKGGAIEFGQAMLKTINMSVGNGQMPDAPPPYTPPTGQWYQAPPPSYAPPPTGYYGWVPPKDVFPQAPPMNTVFMTDMPPPYPGINGYAGYSSGYANASAPPPAGFNIPQQQQPQGGKPNDATQNAYYDPNKPQCAYVPPPSYYEPPPPYMNGNKKSQ